MYEKMTKEGRVIKAGKQGKAYSGKERVEVQDLQRTKSHRKKNGRQMGKKGAAECGAFKRQLNYLLLFSFCICIPLSHFPDMPPIGQ